jgi:hypothetical protein
VLHGAIAHRDHDPVPRPIAPGWYEVIRQRVLYALSGLGPGGGLIVSERLSTRSRTARRECPWCRASG